MIHSAIRLGLNLMYISPDYNEPMANKTKVKNIMLLLRGAACEDDSNLRFFIHLLRCIYFSIELGSSITKLGIMTKDGIQRFITRALSAHIHPPVKLNDFIIGRQQHQVLFKLKCFTFFLLSLSLFNFNFNLRLYCVLM